MNNGDAQACAAIADLRVASGKQETRIDNLEAWQKDQNGHLQRIDARLDRLLWFLIATLASSAGTLLVMVLSRVK